MEYFHISKIDNIKKLTPRLPSMAMTPDGRRIDDTTIPKVSLYPNIRACIIALNLKKPDIERSGSLYYVYRTVGSINVVNDNILVKNKKTHNTHTSEEFWCMQETKVLLVGAIRVFPKSIAEISYMSLTERKELMQPDITDGNDYITAYLWAYTWDRFNIKEKDNLYRESNHSTFESDGVCFNVNTLLRHSAIFPIEYFSVKRLLDTVNPSEMDSEIDKKRIKDANIKIPILVTDYTNGIIMPMDGVHRTCKANLAGVDYLPGKYITPDVKRKAMVPCNGNRLKHPAKNVNYLKW